MRQMETEMARAVSAYHATNRQRVDWVDYAKGFCIALVVMMHATLVVWLAGAALQVATIHTGSTVIDEFAGRFVFFYTGYLAAPRIFALADKMPAEPELVFAGLATWTLINVLLVFNGLGGLALVSLALGLAGAAAVVSLSTLMAKSDVFKPLRYCGRNWIVIYLAFFLPMAASRS